MTLVVTRDPKELNERAWARLAASPRYHPPATAQPAGRPA
jgi:hypothetical protein